VDPTQNRGGFNFGRSIIDNDYLEQVFVPHLLYTGKSFAEHCPLIAARDDN
jgi:hypothetical protein